MGPNNHTSKAMREFFREATHNQYFPEFELLTLSVDQALAYYAKHPGEVKNLIGMYSQSIAAGLPLAAHLQKGSGGVEQWKTGHGLVKCHCRLMASCWWP